MEIVLPATVQRQLGYIGLGVERPGEKVVDTPAGRGLHRSPRGFPRFGGTFTVTKTENASLAGLVELFINQISGGAPAWFKLPFRSGNGALASVVTATVIDDSDDADDGLFEIPAPVTGLVAGAYTLVSAAQALGDTGRLHQVVEVKARAGPGQGTKQAVRLYPDAPPYTGTQYFHPPSYVRAYVPDSAALYNSRQSKAKPNQAIHGPWTVTWTELLGAAQVTAAAGEPAVLGGPGFTAESKGERLGTARTVNTINLNRRLTATRTGDEVEVNVTARDRTIIVNAGDGAFTPAAAGVADHEITDSQADNMGVIRIFGNLTGTSESNPYVIVFPSGTGDSVVVQFATSMWIRVMNKARFQQTGVQGGRSPNMGSITKQGGLCLVYTWRPNSLACVDLG